MRPVSSRIEYYINLHTEERKIIFRDFFYIQISGINKEEARNIPHITQNIPHYVSTNLFNKSKMC